MELLFYGYQYHSRDFKHASQVASKYILYYINKRQSPQNFEDNMRAIDVSLAEKLGIAVVDAFLFLPLAVVYGWRHGREQLKEAGLVLEQGGNSNLEQKYSLDSSRDPISVSTETRASNVIDWVREFEMRNGRRPKVAEVQERFGLAKTTAWRRIRSA